MGKSEIYVLLTKKLMLRDSEYFASVAQSARGFLTRSGVFRVDFYASPPNSKIYSLYTLYAMNFAIKQQWGLSELFKEGVDP